MADPETPQRIKPSGKGIVTIEGKTSQVEIPELLVIKVHEPKKEKE
ncbi:MAG: hypothetical protein ABIH46_10475 [Chloroflexota bacterium]